MKVLVYVEGPGDRAALEALLSSVIAIGQGNGVGIRFLPQGGKHAVLNDVPRKAAGHIHDRPEDWVFAAPDLYPMSAFDGTPNEHRSFNDLRNLLWHRFLQCAQELGLPPDVHRHFRIHCLKYDLEVLLLASRDALRERLGTGHLLQNRWRNPVEDQDDGRPPKHIVEELFEQYRRRPGYNPTIDAPWILRRSPLDDVVNACPQRFAPFVNELRAIATGEVLP